MPPLRIRRAWNTGCTVANGLGRHDNDRMFSFYAHFPRRLPSRDGPRSLSMVPGAAHDFSRRIGVSGFAEPFPGSSSAMEP